MKTADEWVELRKSGQAYSAVKSALGAYFSEEEYVRRIQADAREELIKFIEQCAEGRYARVACLEWLRKHEKCSKP